MNAPEPQTLEEMHARMLAARARMTLAARAPRPGRPKPVVRAPGEIGVRAFQPGIQSAEKLRAEREDALSKAVREANEFIAAGRRDDREPKRSIIARIGKETGFTASDLIGPGRRQPVVRARFKAIRTVKSIYPEMSLPELGRLFGGRDHTTCLHALRRAEELGL